MRHVECATLAVAVLCWPAGSWLTMPEFGPQPGEVGLTCRIASSSCLLSTEASSTSPPGHLQMK